MKKKEGGGEGENKICREKGTYKRVRYKEKERQKYKMDMIWREKERQIYRKTEKRIRSVKSIYFIKN